MTVLVPSQGTDRRESERTRRGGRPRLALGILAVLVLCFAAFSASRMFPPQSYGLADDWRVFYAAATVVGHGGSPYDPALIHPAEQAADRYAVVQPSLDDFANLPVVAWLLQPLTALPFWTSYVLAAALGMIAAAIALLAWLRRWGWRGSAPWAVLAMLSWPALLGVYSGQFDLLLLALAISAMALSMRRHPGLAGTVCTSAALIKPHILWPLPLLLAVSQLPDRRDAARCAAAAVATATAVIAGGEILMPGSTARFLSHLFAFGGRISSVQPDLSGLPGMFAHLPGGGVVAAAVTALGGLATLGFVGYWALNRTALALAPDTRTALGVCAGLALWLVATPYAHPNDDVLLFPMLALVVGADAVHLRQRDLVWALAGAAVLITAFVLSPVAGSVLTLAAAAALWRRWDSIGRGGVAAAALVAIAILPMAWPFHVLVASLTPLAVLLIAVAGMSLVHRTLQPASAGDFTSPRLTPLWGVPEGGTPQLV
ncbi:MAG: glycosyltransferase 87 family protein [Candidatus Dormibacteria bacterium]